MRIGIRPPSRNQVNGTTDPTRSAVQNMGVDHGRLHVVMAQEFLDSTDVVAVFEQMGGEGVPEGVASCSGGRGWPVEAARAVSGWWDP